MQEEKAEWIIYVTDEGQSGHFKLVFGSGKKAGIIPEENPPRIDHVGFGLVLNKDGKRIRTRDMGEVSSTHCSERLRGRHIACMPCELGASASCMRCFRAKLTCQLCFTVAECFSKEA